MNPHNARLRRALAAAVTSFVVLCVGLAAPAFACGGLVAPNGSVRLTKTATLAAYVDGTEHYITSFNFASTESSFGSIVPLPGEPSKVERAGDWTLQRLAREVAPKTANLRTEQFAAAGDSADEAQVLLQTKIDSLDITILKGGGKEVSEWAGKNGFTLDSGTPKMLEFYSARSKYFMAAKFDGADAKARGLQQGDGIPIALTIPTRNPWVPLKILSLGKPGEEIVDADVFLLTEDKPAILSTPGTSIGLSGEASQSLLDDLRSDKSSEWIPQEGWLTHVRVASPARNLTQDLAIDTSGRDKPSLIDAGLATPIGITTGIDGSPTTDPTPTIATTDPQSAFAGPVNPGLAQDSSGGLGWIAILAAILVGSAVTLLGSVAFFTRNPMKVTTAPMRQTSHLMPTEMPDRPPVR